MWKDRGKDAHPHILVVDDDESIRETLKGALEDEGYVVTLAADGAQALPILRQARAPMIVLLDMRMPRMDGLSLLRRIVTREPQLIAHRYLLVTASHDMLTPVGRRVLERLAASVVPKPFDLEMLLRRVEQEARALPLPGATSAPGAADAPAVPGHPAASANRVDTLAAPSPEDAPPVTPDVAAQESDEPPYLARMMRVTELPRWSESEQYSHMGV